MGCCWLIIILKQESTADDGDEESEIHDDDEESGQVVLAYIPKIELSLCNICMQDCILIFFMIVLIAWLMVLIYG